MIKFREHHLIETTVRQKVEFVIANAELSNRRLSLTDIKTAFRICRGQLTADDAIEKTIQQSKLKRRTC